MKLETWKKLNDNDKVLKYHELSNHDKYLVRISEPISVKVVGNKKITDKDKETLKELQKYAKNLFYSSKIEQLANMVIMVIEYNNIVAFGSDEHYEVFKIFENMTSIEEIKTINNKHIKEALEYIKKDKRLLNILKENDIYINTI